MQTIRIIAELPRNGQTTIRHLIGREFPILRHNYTNSDKRKPDGSVQIITDCAVLSGEITLNPGEFEIVS